MRGIKFRAWDIEKKQMIYPNADSKEWDYFHLTLQGEVCLYDTDDYGKTGLWEHNIDYKEGRFILMQFTGLKDKNGKEIYEGDYLKTHRQGNVEDQLNGYVYFEGGSFCIAKWKSLPIHALWLAGDVFEIIGNIHQNPELLGEVT